MKFHFLIISVLIFSYSCNQSPENDLNATEQVFKLDFETVPNSFYITTRAWGLTGDHQEIFLTKNKNQSVSNKETDYIFYCSEIFYKQTNNTLIIYAPKDLTIEPTESFSEITVIIKGLANYDEIKNYNLNYKKYGLTKISVLGNSN